MVGDLMILAAGIYLGVLCGHGVIRVANTAIGQLVLTALAMVAFTVWGLYGHA